MTPFVRVGAYVPDMHNLSALEAHEAKIGRVADYRVLFIGWNEAFPSDTCSALIARGTTPIVTIEPHVLDGNGVFVSAPTLTEIASGDEDAHIEALATAAAPFGSDVIVRFMHEMNNNGYAWGCGPDNAQGRTTNTPALSVLAQQNFHDVFSALSPDTLHLWCPNRNGPNPNVTPAENWSASYADQFFPGDAYCDYIGFDFYCSDGDWNTPWGSPWSLAQDIYNEVAALSSKPLIIAETASRAYEGRKAEWIRLLFAALRTHMPRVEGVCWFDKPDADTGASWAIEDSAVASDDPLSAYRDEMYLLDKSVSIREVPAAWSGTLQVEGASWAACRDAAAASAFYANENLLPRSNYSPAWANDYHLGRALAQFDIPALGGTVRSCILTAREQYWMGDDGTADTVPGGQINHIVSTPITAQPVLADFGLIEHTAALNSFPAMPGAGVHARLLGLTPQSNSTVVLGLVTDDDLTDTPPTTGYTRHVEWDGYLAADPPTVILTVLATTPTVTTSARCLPAASGLSLGAIVPLDASDPMVFDAAPATVTWSEEHGPELLTVPMVIDERDLPRLRRARVRAYGSYGLSWEGYITEASTSGIEASGPDSVMAQGRAVPRTYVDTNLSEYRERTYSGRATQIGVGVNETRLVYILSKGSTLPDGSVDAPYNGMFRVYPATIADAYLVMAWTRYSTSYTVKSSWGMASGDVDGYEVVSWLGSATYESGPGNLSGTDTVHITDDFNVLLHQVLYDGSGVTASGPMTLATFDPTLYGVATMGVGSATPDGIIAHAFAQAPSWLTGADAGAFAASLGAEIVPFSLDNATPADIIAEARRYQACRCMWAKYRSLTVPGFRPVLDAAPSAYAYVVDLRDSTTTHDGFGALGTDGLANKCEVNYETRDGTKRTRTVTAAAGNWLDTIGAEQWLEIDIGRASAATADRIAQTAVDEASAEAHAGTVTTRNVWAPQGVPVPVEHLRCGERVLVLGLDDAPTPRLRSLSVTGGEATLTLDSASDDLSVVLARLQATQNR